MYSERLRGLKFVIFGFIFLCVPPIARAQAEDPFKIGWIGALTGPHVKYGSAQAALIAVDDINANGGVLGKQLELIMEDGQGKGGVANSAFKKLTTVDGMRFIIGGHGTPESAALAPLAKGAGVVLLAAITSSPVLSGSSPNFFRITAVSLQAAELLGRHMLQEAKLSKVAIFAEETDYVLPVAKRLKEVFEQGGGVVSTVINFSPGETDFRASLARVKNLGIEAIYVGAQSRDTAQLMLRQFRELGLAAKLYGNEISGNAAAGDPASGALFKGLIFAEPDFDLNAPVVKPFMEQFKTRYGLTSLPMGIWTAEAYDAVRLMAKVINECGAEVEAVKECLRRVKDYQGVSGSITINAQQDGVRAYILKVVEADGKPKRIG